MSSTKTRTHVYKHYDQTALDSQYNNRTRVPEFAEIIERWRSDSMALRQSTRRHLGVSYGTHEREYLDILPAAQPDAPVHVFIHGGYWQAFNASDFHFVAEPFLAQGVTTVFVNYPLAPVVTMDAIVASCRRAILWIGRYIADYGGNPQQLYLSGHSAGAHLVAMMLSTKWTCLAEKHVEIRGACALSGLFDLTPIQLCYLNDTIRMDEGTARRNSPIHLLPTNDSPLILAVGERESMEFHAQSQELAGAWTGQGGLISEVVVQDANHLTVLDALSRPDGELHRTILSQIGR